MVWVLGDLNASLLMPVVWHAVGGVAGYSASQVTTYYVIAMAVTQIVTCHLLWDIAVDIREGAFSVSLTRPIPYFWFSLARNIAWRIGKLVLFVPVLCVLLMVYGLPELNTVSFGFEFWVALVMGQSMSFAAAYCMAMVTLWTTEFESLFWLYYLPDLLFSGRVVPLSAFPDWAKGLASVSHFRYTVGFPTEIAMGRLSPGDVWFGLAMQSGYLLAFAWLGQALFRRGVRQYAGFGS